MVRDYNSPNRIKNYVHTDLNRSSLKMSGILYNFKASPYKTLINYKRINNDITVKRPGTYYLNEAK